VAKGTDRYSRIIPRDPRRNVLFRRRVLEEASNDEVKRACLIKMCERDICFFVNLFLWTFDPRAMKEGKVPVNPFATWEIQDEYLNLLARWMGEKDIVCEKSRDQGVTWLTLAFFVWDFCFGQNRHGLTASWKEDYVFSLKNPQTLFWKINFMLEKLPGWLRPNIVQVKESFCNIDRDNYITGESTTADLGRAGRNSYIFLDEFAKMEGGYSIEESTRAVSDSRCFVSTARGHNHFKDMVDKESDDVKHMRIHWVTHPVHSKGLYYGADGKPRSPWYDTQVNRAINKKSVARELDISYDESTDRQFSEDLVSTLLNNVCKAPGARGMLQFDSETNRMTFVPSLKDDQMAIWFPLSDYGGPPSGYGYTCGCDISMGNGFKRSSNSVASVWCDQTGEKVAEFTTNDLEPSVFAHAVLPILHWFSPGTPCALIWEDNGPGHNFGRVILEAGYRNIYLRRNETRLRTKTTDVPGFFSQAGPKRDVLDTYARMMLEQRAYNRSQDAVLEMRQFVILKGGAIEHQKAVTSEDTADGGANHGDRVIADALAVWWMWKRGLLRDTRKLEWKAARAPDADCREYIDRIRELQTVGGEPKW
jgi:hypothetical protein